MKSLKKRMLPYLISYIANPVQNLILATCKIEIDGIPNFYQAVRSGPAIVCMWHNRMGPFINFLYRIGEEALTYKFVSLASQSRDGELMARLLSNIPKSQVIRVPANGKHHALRAAMDAFKEPKTVLCLTPDGPRGPKYEVKPGIALLARSSKAQVIPMSWTSERFIELKSWDNFRVPLPFTKVRVTLGEPVSFAQKSPSIEEDIQKIQAALEHVSN